MREGGTIFARRADWFFTSLVLYTMLRFMGTTQPPVPRFFCWRGPLRAEFVTLEDAKAWYREHGGFLTDSEEQPEPRWTEPSPGQVAAAEGAY